MTDDATNKKWRVKLYELEANGTWLDQGTGFVSCQHVQNIGSLALVITGEEGSNHILLESKIVTDDVYEKQGDSIVMWREHCPAGDVDYALSFQDTSGCQSVWASVMNIQQQYRYAREQNLKSNEHIVDSSSGGPPTGNSASSGRIASGLDLDEDCRVNGHVYDDRYEHGHVNSQYMYDDNEGTSDWSPYGHDLYRPSASSPTNLECHTSEYAPQLYLPTIPNVEFGNIEKIRDLFSGMNPHHREAYALAIVQNSAQFLREIMKLFDEVDTRYRKFLESEDSVVRRLPGEVLNKKSETNVVEATSIDMVVIETDKSEGTSVESTVDAGYENIGDSVDDLLILRYFAEIARSILTLNDSAVLQYLVGDKEAFMNLARILEYDGAITDYRKCNHTSFLKIHANRKHVKCHHSGEILQLDEEIIDTVDRLFRLNYLKDVMMRPNEEIYMGHQSSTINSMLTFDSCEIVSHLCTHPHYMKELLLIINSGGDDATNRSDAICILRDFFFVSRNILSTKRVELYSILMQNLETEFFGAISTILRLRILGRSTSFQPAVDDGNGQGYYTVRGLIQRESLSLPSQEMLVGADNAYVSDRDILAISEALATFTVICPSILRDWIRRGSIPIHSVQKANSIQVTPTNPRTMIELACATSYTKQNLDCLLFLLVDTLVNEKNNAAVEQLSDVIKVLVNTDRMLIEDKDTFLSNFYDHYISQLLSPFCARFEIVKTFLDNAKNGAKPADGSISSCDMVIFDQDSSSVSASRRHLCEIIGACVQTHTFRMKNYLIRHNVIGNVLSTITASCNKHHHVLALKIFRYIVSTRDEAYYRHIVKNEHLNIIIKCLQQNIKRYNLISSIILELLEFIRFENIKVLIVYIVEKCMSPSARECAGTSNGIDGALDVNACVSYIGAYSDIFHQIKAKYDMNMFEDDSAIATCDGVSTEGSGYKRHFSALMRKRNQSLYDAESEDAYFEEDDDDEGKKEYSCNSSLRERAIGDPLSGIAGYGEDEWDEADEMDDLEQAYNENKRAKMNGNSNNALNGNSGSNTEECSVGPDDNIQSTPADSASDVNMDAADSPPLPPLLSPQETEEEDLILTPIPKRKAKIVMNVNISKKL